jgi:hypothetical protein
VGYIDNAIPGNQFRLRYDAAYDDRRPNRAEFFWPKGAPLGPGVPRPETNVDYQDLSADLEFALTRRLSTFVELPWRFVHPDVNPNAAGFADMNAGFKYAFLFTPDRVATFQFRTYIPTGDGARGFGNEHVSLEPALLVYQRLSDKLGIEGELRYWVPSGGTDFAGDIMRYGIGLYYDIYRNNRFRVSPVAEFVGWTVLGGKESFPHPSGLVSVEEAAGQTIVNAKAGLRLTTGSRSDLYAGYGQALTGDRWYADTFRLEFRIRY